MVVKLSIINQFWYQASKKFWYFSPAVALIECILYNNFRK